MRKLFEQNRHLFLSLIFANFLLAFGHRVWQVMFNNFAVETIGVGPEAIGLIQSVREIPGLLVIGIALLALLFSELRIMALSLVVLGLGIALTGQATTLPVLLGATLVMSLGFHYFEPGSNGVILMSIDREETPKVLGLLKGLGALSALLATGVVILFAERIGYRAMFLTVGLLVSAGGALLFLLGKGGHELPKRRKMRLRKKYWLFYTMAFLMGTRRHIFTTFAIFLLVQNHGISVQTTGLLFLVNSLINIVVYPQIGRLVPRIGEKAVLTITFATLIPVFLGYAYVHALPVLFVLYVIDNVLFGGNMAMTTYLQKIAVSPEELTTNLAVQTAINHVSAVIIPLVGGAIWAMFGSQAPFLVGVGVAVLSLILVQGMKISDKRYPAQAT